MTSDEIDNNWFSLEEGLVRARLSETEIDVLAKELSLDMTRWESWITLERMTMW